MEEADDLEGELEEPEEPEGLQEPGPQPEVAKPGKTILDISIVPFEPITTGSGQGIPEKQSRLAKAIQERIPAENLMRLRTEAADRLVTLTVLFYLWEGSSTVTNTRPVKDLDNLLKILFDVLKLGPQGLGVVESDSYICEVYANKQLVDSEEEEGYRIIVEEYDDETMLGSLKGTRSKGKK